MTALCLQKLAASMNHQVILPAAIKPHVFTNLAWDNIERIEETLSGKGTTHRVNGIVVQPRTYGPDLPREQLPPIEKTKQRSIAAESHELTGYISGERIAPQGLEASANLDVSCVTEAGNSRKKTFAWMLARKVNEEEQTTPSWTGFNIKVRNDVYISEDIVGYLPTINAPATEMTTVFEILNQTELIRKLLQLQTIVLVMDQALYSKASEIKWQHQQKYPQIVLRLGVFHTICTALAILGKKDSKMLV